MPLLPRKNSLDYNPDSTILASKKITNIALERMKNPLEDPDQATLSTLDRQKNLTSTIDRLLEMAGIFHSVVLRIQNLLAPSSASKKGSGRKGNYKGGSNGDDPQEILRKIASKLRDRRVADDDDGHSALKNIVDVLRARRQAGADSDDEFSSSASSAPSAPSASSSSLSSFDPRFSSSFSNISSNSTANSTSTGSIDFDDDFSFPSFSSFPSFEPPYNYDDYTDSISELTIPSNITRDERNWTSLIFYLITITRRMNILISSGIKPTINSLNQNQIQSLTQIYLMVRSSYDDITRPLTRRFEDPYSRELTGETMKDPFSKVIRNPNPNASQIYGLSNVERNLMRQNQYGDEILNTFNSERRELLLNLTVIINSWKQNTPTGQQTDFGDELEEDFQRTARNNKQLYTSLQKEDLLNSNVIVGSGRKPRGRPKKNTMTQTFIGAGRNFYGEKVDDSRDIPTIWGSYKNCPTKYLL